MSWRGTYQRGAKPDSYSTSGRLVSAIGLTPSMTTRRRRSGSANVSRVASGTGVRKRPTDTPLRGACCQDKPMIVFLSLRAMTAFLQGPGVAVRVGEVGEAGLFATLRIQPAAPSA